MNKKFSTLMALALLAGSFPVAAQFCPTPQGEIDYHSRMVKAGDLDATFKDVDKINQNYYYQLQVDPTSLGLKKTEATNYVLSAERDYSTGKIYLTAQPVTNATLTHTLWKITVTDRAVHGRVYSYKNLETGYELAFDHTNALQRKGGVITQGTWDYEDDGLMDGCITNWSWYTTDEDKNAKDFKKVFAYFHSQTDSVIALQAVKKSDTWNNYNERPTTGLSEILLDGKKTGFTIVAVKDSKLNASEFLNDMTGLLKIKPVEAGAKVLTAAEINTMIDADKSWLTFGRNGSTHISEYGKWNNAEDLWSDDENKGVGKKTKFTVWNPETKKARTIYDNPFDKEFVAVEAGKTSNGFDLTREASNDYAGYNVLLRTLNKNTDQAYKYLYVSENPYEGDAFQGIYNGLQVKTEAYSYLEGPGFSTRKYVQEYATDGSYVNNKQQVGGSLYYPDALQARYHWKVTFYPTRDSVVMEPLNASRMSQSEAEQKLKFEQTHLAKASMSQYLNTPNAGVAYSGSAALLEMNTMVVKAAGVPVALYVMNLGPTDGDKEDYLTVGYATAKGINASDVKWAAVKKSEPGNPAFVTNEPDGTYRSAMKMRLDFVNDYTSLIRATVESGLHFINLVDPELSNGQTEHRIDGAYLVNDMKGHLVYDVQEAGEQDFTHMPATQWVVEQQPCVEGDELNNNENPVVRIINREFANTIFEGQLYKDEDGRLFTINHREYRWKMIPSNVDIHPRDHFNCNDRVAFNKIENPTIEGYFNAEEDVLRENVYTFQHMYNKGLGQSLVDVDGKLKVGENATEFELFRCGVYVEEQHMVDEFDRVTGKIVKQWNGNYDIKYKKTENYGYTNAALGAEQLQKTFFKIKVKDDNLIDNDHKFVAINNQHKYVIATESEIEKNKNLSFAIVSLKENNCLDGTHGYALVNKPEISAAVAGVKEASDLIKKSVTDEYGNTYITYVDSKDKVIFEVNKNNIQLWGKLAVEAISLDTKISDLCETSTDAFALVINNRPLYRDLAKTEYAYLVNNDKKAIDIRTIDEQGNASLYEDSNSPKALVNKLNYLASETMGDPTQNEGFYVDKVAKSNARMPQYLFAVAADSVPAYTYCNCQVAGHEQHGINYDCGHAEKFAGYVEGRFLVNFNDSIKKYTSIDKDPIKANKFASDNYVRLGFVEAVHRGDYLYVLKAPYTLASLKLASKNPAENGRLYICPDSLAPEKEGIIYDLVELDGKHNNVAFSLRNTGDGEEFLIESNGPSSAIGSFTGAWVKIHNYVPVLARFDDKNGNHDTDDTTDSALDTEYVSNMNEVINQSARFEFNVIDKDSEATANEEIATSSVIVAGVDGAVVVKGAEGKNVIVSTILGKVVANETVSSDNATIAAPQGVVVVSVDGESFKVVVK